MPGRSTRRTSAVLVCALLFALGAVLLGLAAGTAHSPRAAAEGRDDPGSSPCSAVSGSGVDDLHCDWFGENGMALPPEVTLAPDASATRATCIGDGRSGMRVQPVLFVPPGGLKPEELKRRTFQIRSALHGVDVAYQQSGLKTGAPRSVRWVTGADCEPEIRIVTVPNGLLDRRAPGFLDAMMLLFGAPDEDRRIFLGFWTDSPSWGIAELTGDDRAGPRNENARGNRFGMVYGIPSAFVAGHELGHLLGAVATSAPGSSGYGHCTSLFDILCYADAKGVRMDRDCGFSEFNRLDCGNDDYFASVPRGDYLSTHWNIADSPYLDSAVQPEPCADVAMEPDDWRSIYLNLVSPKRVFAAPVLAIGAAHRRLFCDSLDWADRARVSLRQGETYRIEVSGLSGATTTLIRVWDPTIRRYVASNAGSSDPFSLFFTATRRGAFGVEVINRHPGQGTGTPFTVRVVAGESGKSAIVPAVG